MMCPFLVVPFSALTESFWKHSHCVFVKNVFLIRVGETRKCHATELKGSAEFLGKSPVKIPDR